MIMQIKKWFFWWAYLDFEHTCDRRKTYFGRCSEEIGFKNMEMIRSLSAFFCVISLFVLASTYTYFPAKSLRRLYFFILAVEAAFFIVSILLMKKRRAPGVYNAVTSIFLLHMLAIGCYIGTKFSVNESATVFLVILVISQMLFILPPILTAPIAALATVATLITSYFIKSEFYFKSDIINCIGVFILSFLLGWLINKIRAEESFSRARAIELNNELQHISVTDQLTALPNHRSFQDTYYKLFETARKAGTRISVIMLDIDKFKAYNDNYGHIEGDKCLCAIGAVFQKRKPEDVTVYRFGGEEFVALLSGEACDRAEETADRLRLAIESLCIPHAFSTTGNVVTASLGLYIGLPKEGEMPMGFVDKADRAMYQSKANGGNRLTIFS